MRFVACLAIATVAFGCDGDGSPDPKKDAPEMPIDAPPVDGDGIQIDAPPAAVCDGTNDKWLDTCTADSECNNCMCKTIGHSKLCTKSCTPGSGMAECPTPSTGCAANGFCAK